MSEYGNDFITLTDEEGNEVELEHLDTIEHEGGEYMLFGIEDPDDEEEMAVVIMQAVVVGDEELLEEVEDERILDEVYAIFMERVDDELQ